MPNQVVSAETVNNSKSWIDKTNKCHYNADLHGTGNRITVLCVLYPSL